MSRLPFDLITQRCDQSAIPVTLADREGADFPLIHVNQAFQDLTGFGPSEAIGKSCRFLQGPGTDKAVPKHIREKLVAGESVCSIITNYRKSGDMFQNFLIIEQLRSAEGRDLFVGFQYEIFDHTQRADLSSHIRYVAETERRLGKSEDIAQDHLLLALRQRSDAALLALKILTRNNPS